MESGKHTHLLKSFFERLELAGITVSPADYVRIASMLDSKLKEQLEGEGDLLDISKIKYLIAPIIARSSADQQLVYKVFDDYMSDIKLYTAKHIETSSNSFSDLLKSGTDFSKPLSIRRIVLAILLCVFAIIGSVIIASVEKESYAWEIQDFPKDWVIGDSIEINYVQTGKDDEQVFNYYWQLYDRSDNEVYSDTTKKSSWNYDVDPELNSDYLYLVFSVFDTTENQIFRDTTPNASVYCADQPVLSGIQINGEIGKYKELVFEPVIESDSSDLNYEWTISSGNESVSHYEKIFSYKTGGEEIINIELKAFRPSIGVNCESTLYKALELEQRTEPPFAEIELRSLVGFEGLSTARFKLIVWIVWGVLFLSAFYLLWLFKSRLKYQREHNESDKLEKASKASSDKPPFSIEFKNENKSIHSFEERSVLSKAMHERKYNDGQLIDVSGSINATIVDSGFPNLIYKKDSERVQYLFLIHQSNRHSHDARLFEHLADLMNEDDVLMLTLYYMDNPAVPYSKDYPNGIHIHQLKSKYGSFRVLLFTDGRELINFQSGNRFGIDLETLELKSVFEDVFFITPNPAANWSVNEATLYRLGLVFSANLNGLLELSKCLEDYDAEDDRETFKDWRARFLVNSNESDEDFEDYKSPEPYRELLNSKLLYEWFLALSVFPSPNWDFTISVGKALESEGLYLSFENLLKLSRIPALHKASYHPTLLDKMHKGLQEIPKVESIARRVLQQKLKEFDYQHLDCFVSGTHEVLTVKNDFLIDPEDESNINNVLRLIKEKRFSKLDLGDLIRHRVDPELQKSVGKSYKNGLNRLSDSLNSSVKDFQSNRSKGRWVVGLSLSIWALFLIYCFNLILVFDNTPQLANLSKENELGYFMNIDETMPLGMQLNNEAVKIFEENNEQLLQNPSDSNQLVLDEIQSVLDSALVTMPESQFIRLNYLNNQLNSGLTKLKYIEEGNLWSSTYSEQLINEFSQQINAVSDTVEYADKDSIDNLTYYRELLHLQGLAYYYDGKFIESIAIRDSLIDNDQEYFSSISYSPTLLELMPLGEIAKQFKMEGYVFDAKRSPYDQAKIVVGNFSVETDDTGFYSIVVDNPLSLNRMEVLIEAGGVFDKVAVIESVRIDNRLFYEKDFTISSSSDILEEEQQAEPEKITIEVVDDRQNPLDNVELYFGEQRVIVNGSRTIDIPKLKGNTIQISATKKGYRSYARTVLSKQIVDGGELKIDMKKEPKIISLEGNVHDDRGQGLEGYTIHLGDDCISKSSGRDGRFSLSCEIPPYSEVPRFLVLRNSSGRVVKRKELTRNRIYLFTVDSRKN